MTMPHRSRLGAVLAALLSSACLPIPQVTPQGLTPRYLGAEASEVFMNCAQTRESVWITGPDQVQMKISPLHAPDAGVVQLDLRLVSSGGMRTVSIPPQTLALTPLDGGPARRLALEGGAARPLSMTDPRREPIKELDLGLRIEEVPKAGLRLQLPEVRMDGKVWRPQALELRPRGAGVRLMPFNC
jgi:hypothetical protein